MREAVVYRRDAFRRGLRAAGYELVERIDKPQPDDVVVMWNRYGHWNEEARRFEAAGARVVVAENGYLGKSWVGDSPWFALALCHHAGAGKWNVGNDDRWDSLGVELAPWRTGGNETVVLGQRGIGERGIASPDGWEQRTRSKIRDSRIRPHPDTRGPPAVEFENDLRDASAVVTWASSAALRALLLGIPVWYEMPKWIGAGAARPLSEFGAEPKRDDVARLAMFRRLIFAMWRLEEIESGEAFRHLLA